MLNETSGNPARCAKDLPDMVTLEGRMMLKPETEFIGVHCICWWKDSYLNLVDKTEEKK